MNTNWIVPDFHKVQPQVTPSAEPKRMLSVEIDSSGHTTVAVNSSSLSVLQTCPRKAKYVLHEGYKSRSLAPALSYGLAMHKALEIFYSHGSRERTLPDDFEAMAPLIAKGHEKPSQHFIWDVLKAFVDTAEPLKGLPDTDKRSITSGVWVLMHYIKSYLHDTYRIYVDEKGPFVERSFECTLHKELGLEIKLFGTVDFVLQNEVTGDVLPGDHKTSSQMGADFLNRIKPNHQYTAYLFGAREVFGINTQNFLVNGIQTKARPITSRGGPPTFTRQVTSRTDQDMDEFRDSVVEAVKNYLRWVRTNKFPLGVVDACASWGSCPYLEVCSAPDVLRQNILDAKFRREKWG